MSKADSHRHFLVGITLHNATNRKTSKALSMRMSIKVSVIIVIITMLSGCYLPPPGYGHYPQAPIAYGPGGPIPPGMYRAMENSAWTGSSDPVYVPSGARPGCMEYRGTKDVNGSPQPLVRTICPAPDGSLRMVTAATDTP